MPTFQYDDNPYAQQLIEEAVPSVDPGPADKDKDKGKGGPGEKQPAAPGEVREAFFRVITLLDFPKGYDFTGTMLGGRPGGHGQLAKTGDRRESGDHARMEFSSPWIRAKVGESGLADVTVTIGVGMLAFKSRLLDEPVPVARGDVAIEPGESQSASIPEGSHHVFSFRVTVSDSSCEGSYTPKLFVRVVGGSLSDAQMARLGSPMASTPAFDPKTGKPLKDATGKQATERLGHASLRKEGRNLVSFTWPRVKKRCGSYRVDANLSTDLPVSPATPYAIVEITSENPHPVAVMTAEINVGAGSGPQDEKKKSAQQRKTEPTKARLYASGGPAAAKRKSSPPSGWHSRPFSAPSQTLESLGDTGTVSFDPRSVIGLGDDIGEGGGGADATGPWTQLDLIVDPADSADADAGLDRGDVAGPNIVRGLFNGYFKGFIDGPRL